MKGDVVLEEHHRRAAEAIVARIHDELAARDHDQSRSRWRASPAAGNPRRAWGYLRTPSRRAAWPRSCWARTTTSPAPEVERCATARGHRLVGPQEVRLDLLDSHLEAARRGDDTGHQARGDLRRRRRHGRDRRPVRRALVIAEDAYTSLLGHVDTRVFIARNRLETLDTRTRRGSSSTRSSRRCWKFEHSIIFQHRARADVVISRDYDVEFPTPTPA